MTRSLVMLSGPLPAWIRHWIHCPSEPTCSISLRQYGVRSSQDLQDGKKLRYRCKGIRIYSTVQNRYTLTGEGVVWQASPLGLHNPSRTSSCPGRSSPSPTPSHGRNHHAGTRPSDQEKMKSRWCGNTAAIMLPPSCSPWCWWCWWETTMRSRPSSLRNQDPSGPFPPPPGPRSIQRLGVRGKFKLSYMISDSSYVKWNRPPFYEAWSSAR